MIRIQSRSGNSGKNGGWVRILVRCSGYPFHSAGGAIISPDLQPFIDAILVEEVFAGHDTEIFFGFVVIQTYQALVQGLEGIKVGGGIEAHPVNTIGSHSTLSSILRDVC